MKTHENQYNQFPNISIKTNISINQGGTNPLAYQPEASKKSCLASEKSTSLAILSSRFLKSFKFVSLISLREKKFYCCLSFASFWAVTLKGTNTYIHEDFPNLHIKPQTISLHLQWLGWYNLNVSFFYWSTFIVFNIIKKHYVSRKKLLG